MKARKPYSYAATTKSAISDEPINTWLIRPAAGVIVRMLYSTPVTPNAVTLASIAFGCCAAYFYAQGTAGWTAAAGLFLTCKDILDSADGQLARAKEQYSRFGRFLDSIGDFVVNLLVFISFGSLLARSSGTPEFLTLALLGFLCTTLRVSYHVFYQTSFLHLERAYQVNRTVEEISAEDRQAGRLTLALQRVFLALYGWQDRLMLALDTWSRRGLPHSDDMDRRWYGDRTGLRISGFLGLGTELFVLMLFSVVNRLEAYLAVNLVILNALWGVAVVYRKVMLRRVVEHV